MSNIQTIKAFGTEFRYSKARDFEVIIDANGYINYSKLLERISGNRKKLLQLCESNSGVFDNVYEYEKEKIDAWLKTTKSLMSGFPDIKEIDEILSLPKTMTVAQLVEANVFVEYKGKPNNIAGTYGPRYLIDVLIIFTDSKYYKRIHETLEAIDAYAVANNKSFSGELERIQEQYEDKLKRSQVLMKEKDEVLKRSKHKIKDLNTTIKEIQAQLKASAEREQHLIEQNEELITQGKVDSEYIKRQHEDIDTLHNMLFSVKNTAEDTNRLLRHRDSDIKRLTKAAGYVAHEMKKQTIAQTRVVGLNTDVLVLYKTALKPVDDDVRMQASDSQIWIASYNGDIDNYKDSKLPADRDELYYIESNRLNSFKYLIQHSDIAPFIVRVYQRSILIEEENLEAFIEAVDLVLNEHREFKSIISLENAKEEIEAKKAEAKELRKERDFKASILRAHPRVYIVINHFKRLVYCYLIDDDGNEVLTPLADVDRAHAIKAKWFYRYGTGGRYIQELSISAIYSSTFSSHGDARIRYEE